MTALTDKTYVDTNFLYMIPLTAAVAMSTTGAGMIPITIMINTSAMLTAWVKGVTVTAGLSSGSVQ